MTHEPDERLDQDMRKDDERQRSEEAASHLAGPARSLCLSVCRVLRRSFPHSIHSERSEVSGAEGGARLGSEEGPCHVERLTMERL